MVIKEATEKTLAEYFDEKLSQTMLKDEVVKLLVEAYNIGCEDGNDYAFEGIELNELPT